MTEAFHSLDPRFKPFLHSPLWEERNDMPLSLLSALARLGLDPWSEAASLAELPPETALSRLTELVGRLPGGPSVRSEIRLRCQTLVGLLPPLGAPVGRGRTAAAAAAPSKARLPIAVICSALTVYLVLTVLTSGAGRLGAGEHRPALDRPAPSHPAFAPIH